MVQLLAVQDEVLVHGLEPRANRQGGPGFLMLREQVPSRVARRRSANAVEARGRTHLGRISRDIHLAHVERGRAVEAAVPFDAAFEDADQLGDRCRRRVMFVSSFHYLSSSGVQAFPVWGALRQAEDETPDGGPQNGQAEAGRITRSRQDTQQRIDRDLPLTCRGGGLASAIPGRPPCYPPAVNGAGAKRTGEGKREHGMAGAKAQERRRHGWRCPRTDKRDLRPLDVSAPMVPRPRAEVQRLARQRGEAQSGEGGGEHQE